MPDAMKTLDELVAKRNAAHAFDWSSRKNILGEFTVFYGPHPPARDNQVCQCGSERDADLITHVANNIIPLAAALRTELAAKDAEIAKNERTIGDLRTKFEWQRSRVEEAHKAFHDLTENSSYEFSVHKPEDDNNPAALMRMIAAERDLFHSEIATLRQLCDEQNRLLVEFGMTAYAMTDGENGVGLHVGNLPFTALGVGDVTARAVVDWRHQRDAALAAYTTYTKGRDDAEAKNE